MNLNQNKLLNLNNREQIQQYLINNNINPSYINNNNMNNQIQSKNKAGNYQNFTNKLNMNNMNRSPRSGNNIPVIIDNNKIGNGDINLGIQYANNVNNNNFNSINNLKVQKGNNEMYRYPNSQNY